jgi:hypothetical protein
MCWWQNSLLKEGNVVLNAINLNHCSSIFIAHILLALVFHNSVWFIAMPYDTVTICEGKQHSLYVTVHLQYAADINSIAVCCSV